MYAVMIICAVISTVMLVIWGGLYLKYKKQYSGMLDSIDGKIFTLKDIYFIGLGGIELYEAAKNSKITSTDKAISKMKELAEVFGRDNAELYYYITVSARISLIFTFVPVGLMLICLIKSFIGLILGVLLAFAMIYGVQSGINAAVERKTK